jgi:hypothetical protein
MFPIIYPPFYSVLLYDTSLWEYMKKIVKDFLLNFVTVYFNDFFNIFKDIPLFLSQLKMKMFRKCKL